MNSKDKLMLSKMFVTIITLILYMSNQDQDKRLRWLKDEYAPVYQDICKWVDEPTGDGYL
jgi:hypothetical protein